jgi:hypothetical protein
MKTIKFIFGYSPILGSLSPIIGRGYTMEEVEDDVKHQLQSMIDHDHLRIKASLYTNSFPVVEKLKL